jgi:hypothetical protein
MSSLNDLCCTFIKGLLNDDFKLIQDLLRQIIAEISTQPYEKYGFDLSGFSNDEELVTRFIKCFHLPCQIMNVQVLLNQSNGKEQQMIPSSIATCLQIVLEDCHNKIDPCKQYDKKKDVCRNGNPLINEKKGYHKYICKYHQDDTLAIHLVLASIMSGFRAMTIGKDDRDVSIAQLIALIHDIGKPYTAQMYDINGFLATGFPMHGSIGNMILLPHFCEEMKQYISKEEWIAICTTIGKHMCGYHRTHTEGNIYKRELLCCEDELVKDYLSILRYGDKYAKLPEESIIKTEKLDEFDIKKPFDTELFFKKYNFTNKLSVFLMGTSGSGKSFLANMIQKHYPEICCHVERDCCMAEVITGSYYRFTGKDYSTLYAIYDCYKKLSKAKKILIKAKGKGEIKAQKEYDGLEQDLIRKQGEWNSLEYDKLSIHTVGSDIPDIGQKVNLLFSEKINQAFKNPTIKIILIDTMATLFPGIERCLPQSLSNSFIVHIHVQNFCSRVDGNNVGGTIADQLKVSGPFKVTEPLPQGSLKSMHLKAMSSVSTDLKSDGDKPKCLGQSPFRPHMVTNVVRTVNGQFGYEEAIELLKKFLI